MQTRPIGVVDTDMFLRAAEKIWREEELSALVDYGATHPKAGNVIPGTGGREEAALGARRSRQPWWRARDLFLPQRRYAGLPPLLAYAKSQATDLTADEKRTLTALAAMLKPGRDR